MTWATAQSGVFREAIAMTLKKSGTAWGGLGTDTLKAALYNNSAAPDKDAGVASTGYNTGTWVAANEVTDGTNWPAGGVQVTGGAVSTPSSGVVEFDATDTPQAGTSTTLANVYGCLVYDDAITAGGTVAKQGICFLYFGGPQAVTAGTFTIVYNANGLFRVTV